MNIYLLLNSEGLTGEFLHTYVFILQFKLLLGDNSGKNHLIIFFSEKETKYKLWQLISNFCNLKV